MKQSEEKNKGASHHGEISRTPNQEVSLGRPKMPDEKQTDLNRLEIVNVTSRGRNA